MLWYDAGPLGGGLGPAGGITFLDPPGPVGGERGCRGGDLGLSLSSMGARGGVLGRSLSGRDGPLGGGGDGSLWIGLSGLDIRRGDLGWGTGEGVRVCLW